MRLTSSDGASIDLRPTRYEFPEHLAEEPGDWDANWLLVHGEVRTAEGEAWTFDDPCLTTWEARDLRYWLRSAAEGRVPTTDAPTEGSEGLLVFMEPDLAFSVAASGDDGRAVRVHLSLESVAGRPGTDVEASLDLYALSVRLTVGRGDLLAAAQAWQDDLAGFPER